MSPTRPESKIFGFFDIIHGYKNFFSSLMDNICCNPDTKNSWSKKDFLDLHEKTNSEITPLFRQDYNNSNNAYHLYVLLYDSILTLRCQIIESIRLAFSDFFPPYLHFFHPIILANFPPYSFIRHNFSRISLIQAYSFMYF